MYKAERQHQIQQILRESRQIDVSTLSSLLSVSEATIRSDLEELEKTGFLTRFHGGAAIAEQERDETGGFAPVEESADKRSIGAIAAHLVEDRDGIFLGPGTTNFYIAQELGKRTGGVVNVVTNNFLVAGALHSSSAVRIHFLGGTVSPDGLFTIPDNLESALSNIYLDKMFFSIDGIDLDAGYTLSDTAVQDQILAAAGRANQVIMAADRSKFDNRSFMKIGDLDFAPVVITNPGYPDPYRHYFESHGVTVYTA